MNERTIDYPGRVWVPLAEDVAAGYFHDVLGGWALDGIVIFSPDTAKLRGLKLRELERLAAPPATTGSICQDLPPSREQVAAAWRGVRTGSARTGLELDAVVGIEVDASVVRSGSAGALLAEIAEATAPSELSRRDGEAPDAFYRRVARAYVALRAADEAGLSKRPLTAELALRAGVPVGTAAAWVARARARGLLSGKDDDG